MLKSLLPAAFMATALVAAPAALAASNDATAIEGTYLLMQPNESQRVLALNPGGAVNLISQGQQVRGYTSGLGTWEMTGPETARATIIDFNNPGTEISGNGASQITYDLTFSDEADGRFQSVSGHFAGQAFAKGQNPLAGDSEPARTFKNTFDGSRIVVN
ncbi:hypothetical protein [Roseibium sp. MMSF_3544]|uniref:hypothetical protein n=1 Tax=unclassified Roseibium TaxID=2629323 RepID=UPI00273F9544|nr:hypothetical protein [Roseibium sp. MMSF_3544]